MNSQDRAMMKSTSKEIFICAAVAISCSAAHAEDGGEQAARGAGFAFVVTEKCSAKLEPMTAVTARQKALFVSLQNAGFEFESIKRGYLRGVLMAEGQYPKGTKPTHKECKEATKIKVAIATL